MSEWIKTAKVGDKVVCKIATGAINLVEGQVYTVSRVREIGRYSHWLGCGTVVVYVDGASPNPDSEGFHPERFRPVIPRKTDISVFTDMLRNVPVETREDA